ncbi:hypothetical protein BZM27_54800 [Paraburkholderia steynii]|uniref:Uncharacterized protein n=1 Tax=Paraburkholderia steynii TaxID=1245441 RepID=A0A4R0X078_9BURK|nr:hypothetical protein BZM27_54800 [Paraburkholderia steynii]
MGQARLCSAGDTVVFAREADGRYAYTVNGMTNMLSSTNSTRGSTFENVAEGWEVVHEGLASQYPEHAALLRHRMKGAWYRSVAGLGFPAKTI